MAYTQHQKAFIKSAKGGRYVDLRKLSFADEERLIMQNRSTKDILKRYPEMNEYGKKFAKEELKRRKVKFE
jgi:hypothetical protein